MASTVAEVVALLDDAYPPATAQSWDAVGLVCGDPQAPVRRVLLAVDPVPAVVTEAERMQADLLVVHHPLLLKGVHSVAADTAKGRVLHRLIRAGVALYVAHTNADAAPGGVNDALAGLLGLIDVHPLDPLPPDERFTLVSYVPPAQAEAVIDAAAAAGAGVLGDYTRCAWTGSGTGTFEAGAASNPTIGIAGERSQVPECKIELVVPAHRAGAVLEAVIAAHPYEEPAVQLLAQAAVSHRANSGIGRVGRLESPCSLRDLAERIAQLLPPTAHGVRVSGDLDAQVSTVALCGGAGDSLFGEVRASGADVYLTADLRHHPASEARDFSGDGRPYLIDVSHWASEWPWLPRCAELLAAGFADLDLHVSTLSSDPWNLVLPGSPSNPSTVEGDPR